MYAFGYTEVDIAQTEVLGGCIARCKPPLSHKDTWLVDFQLFVFFLYMDLRIFFHVDLTKLHFQPRERNCSVSGSNSVVAHQRLLAGAMATSSGDDIPTQLAALLGKKKKVAQIRKTDETPPKISVIDVISAVTGKDARHAAEQLRRLVAQYPDVDSHCVHVKFPDSRGRKGQKDTPASGVRGVVEIVMLLQGHAAAKVRRQAAELLCRWLGGDLAIIDEVCALRGFQEELAVRAPEDPRRLFGQVVEASSSSSSSLMTQALSNMNERLTKQEQMLARIHESLEHDRQRVNLNVRAPKRAMPHQPQITRDLAGTGRPFPMARF